MSLFKVGFSNESEWASVAAVACASPQAETRFYAAVAGFSMACAFAESASCPAYLLDQHPGPMLWLWFSIYKPDVLPDLEQYFGVPHPNLA